MPEEDDRKKPWRKRNPFFDILESIGLRDDSFGRMDDEIGMRLPRRDEMLEGMKQDQELMQKLMGDMFKGVGRQSAGKPLVYGVSIKRGPNGKVDIKEFGNVQPTGEKIEVKDMREPLIDVIEHEKEIDVLAELPGVEKQNIDIRAAEDTLTIEVPKKFQKKIQLPAKVKEDSVKAHYKNGVLTVTLQKQKAGKPAKRVEVD